MAMRLKSATHVHHTKLQDDTIALTHGEAIYEAIYQVPVRLHHDELGSG